MDLCTHLGVIWRFRVIVVLGLVLAVGLAFLSVFRVSFANGASVSYRDKQTWLSSETQGGLIAQEDKNNVGSGRLATFWPAIHSEFTPNPMLGEGAFTRVTVPTTEVNVANAPILDDQWLGILLDTGVVGFLSLLWVFVRSVRRMGKAAKRDPSPRGWLLVGTTASVVAYMVSMLTYDSFAFIQATVLLFVSGIGIAALRSKSKEWAALQASRSEPLAPLAERLTDAARQLPGALLAAKIGSRGRVRTARLARERRGRVAPEESDSAGLPEHVAHRPQRKVRRAVSHVVRRPALSRRGHGSGLRPVRPQPGDVEKADPGRPECASRGRSP